MNILVCFGGFGQVKTKPICRPLVGNPKLEVRNPKQALPFGPPKKMDSFCCGRIEIATVAALLRNDIGGLFSFLHILRIRSGARNDNVQGRQMKWRIRPLTAAVLRCMVLV